ncbi:MAG TPA: histidinol-phosphate transaminase [Solirubrobacteraceae bacterium]|jgi:histidinol-phosphate aminotransferase|nr:histidinol-phosphate transaminase [Solirubrobacteraceae bacterium]
MGLLDYYKQFEGMSEEEVNEGLREEAAERRRKALTRVETLDLSLTTWPELPHPRIVSAITFVARRGMHRYPHLSGSDLRGQLAERHGVDPERLILGNGAAELLTAATRALIEPGQQLLTRWPSYPLYPIMARRAHGRAVPVEGGIDGLIEAAANEPDVRAVALASPDDPTGALLPTGDLKRLLEGLPAGVAVLLDEALVDFVDAQPINASLELLERHPNLIVFRSFSKAWGLAGLRIGYAVGGPGSGELLAELAPDLGVSEISQAGAFEALHSCTELIEERTRRICEERPQLIAALREHGFEVPDSQANFVWAAHPTLPGGELAARLARAGILIAAGDALGEPRHARIAVHSQAATDRLINAIEKLT